MTVWFFPTDNGAVRLSNYNHCEGIKTVQFGTNAITGVLVNVY